MILVKKITSYIRSFLGRMMGETMKGYLKNLSPKFSFRVIYPIYQRVLIYKLKRKERINVVFIASALPMWRYQHIYELMSKHPKFKTSIVILPFCEYTQDVQKSDVKTLESYFRSLNIRYIVASEDITFDIKKKLSPDILFYPQPYPGAYTTRYSYLNFKKKLLCYYPYAFWTAKGGWSYNEPLHNYAWKCFYSTELHLEDAVQYAYNKGRNVEVVGYPNADDFLYKKHVDVWKSQSVPKKRLVWAPHFTIESDRILVQSNFLWMSDFMLELVDEYSDKVQFAFKPHPRLITHLYKHKDWGKERATAYYKEWATRENTQLEIGEFVDLFMTSDAMIHDSGSFSVEYHYSKNPVMYIADNFDQQVEQKNEFGKLAMRQHYVGKCKDDIINFIEKVVLKEDDPMKQGREEFYNQYLLPPNGKSVAENTMDVFLKTFC